MSTKAEAKEVTVVGGNITASVTKEDRELVHEILAFEKTATRVGEYLLRLPSLIISVILGTMTGDEWGKMYGVGKNEVTRLRTTATIIYYTDLKSSALALSVYNLVTANSRKTGGPTMEDTMMRFKKASGKDLLGQTAYKWVQGDLEVGSRLAKNSVEEVQAQRKAERIASGKPAPVRKVKTVRQRLDAITADIKAVIEALAMTGVTDDVREGTAEFMDAVGDIVAILTAATPTAE